MDFDPKLWWYVTRASGFVSWALLAVAVLWGLFLTNKTLSKSTAPAWVLDLHRHLGGLAVVFVAIHVGVLPLDTYTDWGWRDLFVPMASSWKPGAIAWGIVAMYLLIAIEFTSLLGRRFPKQWWRRVHMLSFPLYIVASIHLFVAGTDGFNVVSRWMVVVTSTLIAFLTAVRILAAAKPRETRANPRIAAARAQAAATVPAAVTTADTPAPEPADDLLPATAPAVATPRVAKPRVNTVIPDTAIPDTAIPDTAIPDTAIPDTLGAAVIGPSIGPLTVDERAERIRRRAADAAARARQPARSRIRSNSGRGRR